MARWKCCINNLMGPVRTAIMSYKDFFSVWGTVLEKHLSTSCQLRLVSSLAKTGPGFFMSGLTPKGQKCSVIQDSPLQDEKFIMDLPTRSTSSFETPVYSTPTSTFSLATAYSSCLWNCLS
uniref:Uncharacterized protein n=1 Tax=Canis lupus familiaris TaxID=9615 RepID=A0A8P0PFE1_CANLF